jgi:hypothetical protein
MEMMRKILVVWIIRLIVPAGNRPVSIELIGIQKVGYALDGT